MNICNGASQKLIHSLTPITAVPKRYRDKGDEEDGKEVLSYLRSYVVKWASLSIYRLSCFISFFCLSIVVRSFQQPSSRREKRKRKDLKDWDKTTASLSHSLTHTHTGGTKKTVRGRRRRRRRAGRWGGYCYVLYVRTLHKPCS